MFCHGPNVVNKSRSAYSPAKNTFDNLNSLKVCSLAGSKYLKWLCAGHKLVIETRHCNESCEKWTCFVCILRSRIVLFLDETQSSEEKDETQPI